MSIAFGSAVTSQNVNDAFVSRTVDTDMAGKLDNQNTTDSSGSTSGAIVTAGGMGVAKTLHVGQQGYIHGDLTVDGDLNLSDVVVPFWRKYTKSYSDIGFSGLTNSVTLVNLPPNGYIEEIFITHSAAFTGGSISAYTVSVGITGDAENLSSTFDVFQAPGDALGLSNKISAFYSKTSIQSIKLFATSVGANLDQATSGSVDVYIKYGVLP